MARGYAEVDVFSSGPCRGNPVAVVLDGEGLTSEQMQRFAAWTNLSETTFVLPPEDGRADYRLRIFTPGAELPFAGHPTLGSCHAWLEAGGTPRDPASVVQECGVGLVRVRRDRRLSFAAPPLVRSGPVAPAVLGEIVTALRIAPADVVAAAWVDNGPGWLGLLLPSAEAVLSVRPAPLRRFVGVVGPHPPGAAAAVEVRAFFTVDGTTREDPVTGSLNASLAQWLLAEGRLRAPYVAAQGTAIGREGRVHVSTGDGEVWVGGDTVTYVTGTLRL